MELHKQLKTSTSRALKQRYTRNTSGWRRPEEKVITAEFPSSSRLDEAINAQQGIATPSSAFLPREGSEEPILLIHISLSLSLPPRCPLLYSCLVGLRPMDTDCAAILMTFRFSNPSDVPSSRLFISRDFSFDRGSTCLRITFIIQS